MRCRAPIGEHVARFVPDGATIQTGLGKIPTAALRALRGRRGLKIHSGLIPEAVCDLEDAGALAPGVAVTGGVAIGSRRLYERVGGAAYRFEPVSHTHAPRVVAALEKPVAINSALEVDLFGQAYAELGPGGLMSGPGGASDFARGVWAAADCASSRSRPPPRKAASAASSRRAQARARSRSAAWTRTSSSPNTARRICAASIITSARAR